MDKARKRRKPKLSRLHKPPHLSLEEWQIQLRRQFGREQRFRLVNLGHLQALPVELDREWQQWRV